MRGYLGLALFWVGVVYLALTHPLVPGWVWGFLLAALVFALEHRRPAPGLRELVGRWERRSPTSPGSSR